MAFDRQSWLSDLRSKNQPEGYFFTHARFLPDDVLLDPDEYRGQEAIGVSCTQLGDARLQKHLIRKWAAALPHLSSVRRIRFNTKFPNELLIPLSQNQAVREVSMHWSGLKTIAPIAQMAHLEALAIGSSPSIADPEVLVGLPNLRRLSLENIRAVYDLKWLCEMPQLEELRVNGSTWTWQNVESLAPLTCLVNLRRLSLIATRVKDKNSLMALVSMPNLEVFDTHWAWPKGSLRRLVDARPDLWVNGQRGPGWQECEERVMDLN